MSRARLPVPPLRLGANLGHQYYCAPNSNEQYSTGQESCELLNDTSRAFVSTGMLEAFTTVSTFSYETMGLFQNGQTSPALTNLGLQIILGLLAVWGGIQLAKFV